MSKVSKVKLLLLGNVHHALKFGGQKSRSYDVCCQTSSASPDGALVRAVSSRDNRGQWPLPQKRNGSSPAILLRKLNNTPVHQAESIWAAAR